MSNTPETVPCASRVIRVVTMNGVDKFSATDICNILGYVNANKIVGRHCGGAPEYIRLKTAGGPQNVRVIGQADIEAILSHSRSAAVPMLRLWLQERAMPKEPGLTRFWNALIKYVRNEK